MGPKRRARHWGPPTAHQAPSLHASVSLTYGGLFTTSTQSWQGEGPEPSPAPLRAHLGSDSHFTNEGKSERPVDGVGGNSPKRKIPAPSWHKLRAEQWLSQRPPPPAAEGTVWPLPGSHLRCGAHPGSRRGHFSLCLAAPSRRLSPLRRQPVCGQPWGGGSPVLAAHPAGIGTELPLVPITGGTQHPGTPLGTPGWHGQSCTWGGTGRW